MSAHPARLIGGIPADPRGLSIDRSGVQRPGVPISGVEKLQVEGSVASRSAGGWGEDAAAEAPWRVLTAEQARSLRAADPSVSPWRVVWVQALAGALCASAVWIFTASEAGVWSALYGAAATVIPSALMARGMTRGARHAVAAAAGFMFWEMLKIGVAVTMLVIAAKVVPQLSWPLLLVTMVVCIKVNWFALLWRGRRPKDKV